MITYLLKSSACLILLFLVYHFFLEREKMHRFNRCFLLFSLIFSLAIPFLTIYTGSSTFSNYQPSSFFQEIQSNAYISDYVPDTSSKSFTNSNRGYSIDYGSLLFISYLLVSFVLTVRFLWNLYSLYSAIRQNKHISQDDTNIILVDNCNIPYSFFNYIFVNKKEYQKSNIKDTVLIHERAHAQQKHSIDILFIEILKVALWFNPVIYFYKKAIQLNHEFLADNAVILTTQNISTYQKLLLKMKDGPSTISLASSIHYSITKKRIIMMNRQSTRLRTLSKQIALIPLVAGLVFMFGTKAANAQDIQQMSITELMGAVYSKLGSADSLSDKEWKQLHNLTLKIQEELNDRSSPSAEDLETIHNKTWKKFTEHTQAYFNIPAVEENREKLKAEYKKIMAYYNKAYELQRKIHKQDPPPPPPKPLGPTDRIKSNSN